MLLRQLAEEFLAHPFKFMCDAVAVPTGFAVALGHIGGIIGALAGASAFVYTVYRIYDLHDQRKRDKKGRK